MRPAVLILAPKSRVHYHQPYADAVRATGGEPALDWPDGGRFGGEDDVRRFLAPYQGVLIPGGADVDPARYGEKPHPKLGRPDAELDEVQLAVGRVLLEGTRPALAICRGMQVMAVAAGGTLVQDIPSQRPSEVAHNVPEPKDRLAHTVTVRAGSRLSSLSEGRAGFEVNSRHHQAVREPVACDRVGPFEIVARAADGILEGLEAPDAPFLVAVQWHPENLVAAGPGPSRSLFEGFVAACG